jgi:hypothetical protein
VRSYTTEIVLLPFFIFIANPSNNKSFSYSIMPTFLHESSLFTVSSKPASNNMSNAVSSGDENEQRLFTQLEADDITVDSDSPKCKGTTQVDKQASKKKQRPDITDAELDAQLKQVSAFNANNSLLQAATIDKEGDTEEMSKKVTKYFTKPVLGNKSSVWWEGFE